MNEKINQRLEELKAEYHKGEERMAELERETSSLRVSMLRISGAIQVLEEMLHDENGAQKTNAKNEQP